MSDLISRQAVLESLKTDYSLIMFDSYGNLTFTGERIIEAIKRVPSVEPERKPGIWTHEDVGVWICGVCGGEVGEMGDEYGVPKYNFCPYCGVDMTGRRWTDDYISNH